MKSNRPLFAPANEGRVFKVLGSDYIIKVPGVETDGAFSMFEGVVPPQSFLPPHIHTREDETFYILEGAIEVQCAGRTFNAQQGATVVLPRNIPHSFRNSGSTPAKLLVTLTPAGFEGFFEEVAGQLPADQPPDPEKLAAIGRKYGLELLPPAG
jgi:quercetin dioxygenase-like cupin family protein